MKSSKAEELLTFGKSCFPLSNIKGQAVEYIACAAKRPFGTDPAPGFAVRSHGKSGYVMLDIFRLVICPIRAGPQRGPRARK
jgi:hypothetical protein